MGLLYSKLSDKPDLRTGAYQSTNRDMIERVARLWGYEVEFSESGDDEWIFAVFELIPEGSSHLRLVK